MSNKRAGGFALLFLVITFGAFVNLRQPAFPQEAERILDDFIQKIEGPGFNYTIVSTERGTAREIDSNIDLQSYAGFGGNRKPPGMCPPDNPQLEENWCVIIDAPFGNGAGVEVSSGDRVTHFLVRRQGQLWTVQEVPDSGVEIFRQLGCRNW